MARWRPRRARTCGAGGVDPSGRGRRRRIRCRIPDRHARRAMIRPSDERVPSRAEPLELPRHAAPGRAAPGRAAPRRRPAPARSCGGSSPGRTPRSRPPGPPRSPRTVPATATWPRTFPSCPPPSCPPPWWPAGGAGAREGCPAYPWSHRPGRKTTDGSASASDGCPAHPWLHRPGRKTTDGSASASHRTPRPPTTTDRRYRSPGIGPAGGRGGPAAKVRACRAEPGPRSRPPPGAPPPGASDGAGRSERHVDGEPGQLARRRDRGEFGVTRVVGEGVGSA